MCKNGKNNYICLCLYLPEDTIWRDAEETNKSDIWGWPDGIDGLMGLMRLFNIYLFILFGFFNFVNGLCTQNVEFLKKQF